MYGITQLSQVSIDWSAHSRSMLRRTTATCAPMRLRSSRSGPGETKLSVSAVR